MAPVVPKKTPEKAGKKLSARFSPTFSALQNTQFRWLLASNLLYFITLHGQMLTRSVLAWQLTSDEMALAYINAAYAIPMIAFAMIGGALIDRFERRSLTQLAQIIMILNEAIILLLLVSNQLEFWNIIVAGIIGGIFNPVLMSARVSLTFNTVGAAKLGNATALNSSVVNVSRVIGPLIMGGIIAGYNVSAAYVCSVIGFTLSFFGLFGIAKKPVERQPNERPTALFKDIANGLGYIRNTRPVLICLLFGFLPSSLAIPAQSLLILFADNVWQVGESGLGLLMASAGVGGVLGSFWVATRGESRKRVKPMIINALAFACFLCLFSLAGSFHAGLFMLAVATACSSACMTLNNTSLQLIVEDKQRGRVSSFMMMAYGITPLGVLPLAWLAKNFGISPVMSLAAIALFVVILGFYKLSPGLQSLDQSVASALRKHSALQTTNSPADPN